MDLHIALAATLWGAVAATVDGAPFLTDQLLEDGGRILAISLFAEKPAQGEFSNLKFICSAGSVEFALWPGPGLKVKDRVPVHLQFDGGPTLKRDFDWVPNWGMGAIDYDGAGYLDAAISSRWLLAKVGNAYTMSFRFETAHADLFEFQARCSVWGEQEQIRKLPPDSNPPRSLEPSNVPRRQ